MKVIIRDNAKEAALWVAHRIAGAINAKAKISKKPFVLGLPTGSTPLDVYAELDDSDIWCALKAWKHVDDRILSTLATDMLDRHLFKVEVSEERPSKEYIEGIRQNIAEHLNIPYEDTHYLVTLTEIGKDMYNPEDDSIGILYKDGTVKDIADASEILNVQLLSKKIRKYYLCYQRF